MNKHRIWLALLALTGALLTFSITGQASGITKISASEGPSTQVYLPAIYGGSTFYVSTNGSDSNPGSLSKPWRTLQKAADAVRPGQTIKILPGTYNARLVPSSSGAPGSFITFTADPGTVTLDGSGVAMSGLARGDGLVQIAGKSYIRVENLMLRNSSAMCVNISEDGSGKKPSNVEILGLNIQNCKKVGIRARFTENLLVKDNVIDHVELSSGIGAWWSKNVTVDHNTITNARLYGNCQNGYDEVLTISYTSNFQVKYNSLNHTEAGTGCSTADRLGIDVKESSQYGAVYRNTIRNMSAAGIYVDGWDAGSNGKPTLNHIDIFQNQIVQSAGIVIGAEKAEGVVEYINIYNNLLIEPSFAGIQVRKSYGDGLRKNITIYNNTIYGAKPSGGNGGAGIYISTSNLGSNNSDAPVIIRNNISMFYSLGNTSVNWVGQIQAANSTVASKIVADHNIVYGPQKCSDSYPNCQEVGSRISADPGSVFNNAATFDLRLKPGSPAVDAGASVSLVKTDYNGVNRPQPDGHLYDVGAFEHK